MRSVGDLAHGGRSSEVDCVRVVLLAGCARDRAAPNARAGARPAEPRGVRGIITLGVEFAAWDFRGDCGVLASTSSSAGAESSEAGAGDALRRLFGGASVVTWPPFSGACGRGRRWPSPRAWRIVLTLRRLRWGRWRVVRPARGSGDPPCAETCRPKGESRCGDFRDRTADGRREGFGGQHGGESAWAPSMRDGGSDARRARWRGCGGGRRHEVVVGGDEADGHPEFGREVEGVVVRQGDEFRRS